MPTPLRSDEFFGEVHIETTVGITAATTQTQAAGTRLTKGINEVGTVANKDDAVTLMPVVAGLTVTIINHGANDLQIFPAVGDNLEAGANNSRFLEPEEAVTFVGLDATNWHVQAETQIAHAEMTDNENGNAYLILAQTDEHAYHTNGLVAGDLGGGWAFDTGGAGTPHTISAIADGIANGVDIEVTTSDNHLLAVNDIVSHVNLTSGVYTGHFKVKLIVSDTEYEVAAVFTDTDTGTMDQAAVLICPTGGTGTYLCMWSCDASIAGNNEVFDFALHLDTVHQAKSNARRKFGSSGDIGSVSKVCLLDITAGQRVSFMVENVDSAADITLRNLNIVLVRL